MKDVVSRIIEQKDYVQYFQNLLENKQLMQSVGPNQVDRILQQDPKGASREEICAV